jgi:SP family general alpha glucoside:H+ symporter-like MFS transporter
MSPNMVDEKDIETIDTPIPALRNSSSINSAEKVILNAKSATEKEHNMTLWQGIKLYPKAVGWSVLISTCIAMEGYDVCLLSNFYGFPQFNKKYGKQLPNGDWQVPAPWQAGLSNGANVGEIIGLFINGFVSEKYGYRYVCSPWPFSHCNCVLGESSTCWD